jgi:hypothetical protein
MGAGSVSRADRVASRIAHRHQRLTIVPGGAGGCDALAGPVALARQVEREAALVPDLVPVGERFGHWSALAAPGGVIPAEEYRLLPGSRLLTRLMLSIGIVPRASFHTSTIDRPGDVLRAGGPFQAAFARLSLRRPPSRNVDAVTQERSATAGWTGTHQIANTSRRPAGERSDTKNGRSRRPRIITRDCARDDLNCARRGLLGGAGATARQRSFWRVRADERDV